MIKAVIFDMDGVLIQSEEYLGPLELAVLKRYGINISLKNLQKYYGLRQPDYFITIGKDYGKELPIDEIIPDYFAKIKKYYAKDIKAMPGALQTLNLLSQKYQLGLSTSCYQLLAELVLKRLKMYKFFKELTFKHEVDKGKPDPAIFLKTAVKLGVPRNECVVIEDAVNGFRAGKAADMKVIGFKNSLNEDQDFSIADSVVAELINIPEAIDALKT